MEKLHQMSWGHPYFMQSYWTIKDLSSYEIPNFFHMEYSSTTPEIIKNELKKLHNVFKNSNVDDKEIVIGNGATQILSSLMFILKKEVYAEAPCFSRFKTLCDRNKVPFTNTPNKNEIQIITTPNNPDGNSKVIESNSKIKIYDLSYNWPQYTKTRLFNEDIMIYSLSKATGHASTRLGWGIFKDHNLAKEVEKFIEFDTSGVSMDSQNNLLKILNYESKHNYESFKSAKLILDYRWSLISKLKLPFQVLNNKGMFMWCKGEKPSKFAYINGSEFGVSDEYFRLNIGCENKVFSEFYNEYV